MTLDRLRNLGFLLAFLLLGVMLFSIYGSFRSAIEGGNWGKASITLERLKVHAPEMRPLEVRLLEARLFDGRGEADAALAAYRELIPVFVGQEARYRYGELLLRLGQHEAANHMFNEVLTHAKRYASSIEEEQQWVAAARKAIEALFDAKFYED